MSSPKDERALTEDDNIVPSGPATVSCILIYWSELGLKQTCAGLGIWGWLRQEGVTQVHGPWAALGAEKPQCLFPKAGLSQPCLVLHTSAAASAQSAAKVS